VRADEYFNELPVRIVINTIRRLELVIQRRSTQVLAAGLGTDSQSGVPRSIQLALKLLFWFASPISSHCGPLIAWHTLSKKTYWYEDFF
jgi:hypothetical protein